MRASAPVAEIPGDISPRPLTRPLILFAVIRAVAVTIAVAISFGLKLPDADWMPIAAIIAMKPSLQQSALVAEQRVAGTMVGAAVAVAVLLPVDNLTALEVIVVVLLALAASIRTMSYTVYTAAVAAAVLIAADVPDPSNLKTHRQTCPANTAGTASQYHLTLERATLPMSASECLTHWPSPRTALPAPDSTRPPGSPSKAGFAFKATPRA